jgi:hypothetical protein
LYKPKIEGFRSEKGSESPLLHNHFHNQPVHDVLANPSSVWPGCPPP